MKYKAEYEKMVNKYSKLVGFIYGLIGDIKTTDVTKADKATEELQKLVKE
jgi:hypothetical protein